MPPRKGKKGIQNQKGPTGFKHQPGKGPPKFDNPTKTDEGKTVAEKKRNQF